MKLRRRTMNEIKGDPRKQKAVALAICIKRACGRNSAIKNYNPNKVQKLTKISANTFTKYLPLMVELGLVRFNGKNNEHLVICCLYSSDKKRNVDIHRFCFNSFTEVYRSLRAFIALLIQQRKNYVRRTLQIARNPRSDQDFKAAIKTVKRLVRQGVLKSVNEKFNELGISYRRIATETGNCIRTAQRIMDYAIRKRWCRKENHFEWDYLPGVNRMYMEGYTFTTRDYGFKVKANTYTLSKGIEACYGMASN